MNASHPREPVRFLVFSASLRSGSLNAALAELAAVTIEANGGEVDLASMRDFDSPSYDADVQDSEGFPRRRRGAAPAAGAVRWVRDLSAGVQRLDAGALKNAIDWVSRFSPQPFNERYGLLMSASPSMVGGNRGLWALRVPFEHLGARIYPDMFSLAQAHGAFDSEGRLAGAQLQERFDTNVVNFMDPVEAQRHYPCIKKAWVEYLGEHPEPAIDRVE